MRDEIERILSKDGWDEETVEELRVVFEDEEGFLIGVSPDVLETALKLLFRGRGSVEKRVRTVSLMTGLPETFVRKILDLEKFGEKRTGMENPFPDLLERILDLDPRCPESSVLEDARIAWKLSPEFRNILTVSNVHPYIVRVVSSGKAIPLVVDGSNLLWLGNLSVSILEELLFKLSNVRPVYYPIFYVFDANVEHVIPRYERERLREWLNLPCTFLHSPADELMLSIARSEGAHVMSRDRFREYDTSGIETLDFPI